MTAEIAIVNRSALALAADSAVTIRIGNTQKVYDSAEKIFEFSRKNPIALMVYNSVEFVGVPLDVIVRKYRNEEDQPYDCLKDAADLFTRYLETFKHDIKDERNHLNAVLSSAFNALNTRLLGVFKSAIEAQAVSEANNFNFSFEDELSKLIREDTDRHEAAKLDNYLVEVSIDQFTKRYGDVIKDAVGRIRFPIDPSKVLKLFEVYALAIVRSKIGSEILTGLVFGGFGKKDLFPTLDYIEIDGIYFDKLKVLSQKEIDIDRRGEKTAMLPSAQKEMVERFMYGLDSEIHEKILWFVGKATDEILNSKMGAFDGGEKVNIKKSVVREFGNMINKLMELERHSIQDIVNFMSKKELAEMAHALVELTSKKRRFSTDQETVGGPIDVAIVTRNEGFIWIRRKHYFDQAVNPGYYARVFAKEKGGENDSQTSGENHF